MAAEIKVQKVDEGEFRVTVTEGSTESTHLVGVKPEYHRKLTGGKVDEARLVRASFEFLLEREAKESILTRFDLPVISRYFPEYETEIRKKLSR
jgi:hypothetical protein